MKSTRNYFYWLVYIFCSLQADLGMITNITGFATQGARYLVEHWTERYSLGFSRDGENFFADTPPLNPYNAPSDEDRRVMIHVLVIYC